MRRYEKDGTFWEIAVEGAETIRRSGATASKGRTQRRSYPSALGARCRAEAAVQEKLQEGFKLVGDAEPFAGPGRGGDVHPALEAKLAADPRDVETALVYGDWLQARGDPRGELIAVQYEMVQARGVRAEELRRTELRLLERHGAALLGDLADMQDLVELDWNVGFIRAARLGVGRAGVRKLRERIGECFGSLPVYTALGAMVPELFALRSARFLEALSLESVGSDIYPLDVVVEHAPATLHTLEIPNTAALRGTLYHQRGGEYADELQQQAFVDYGVWLASSPPRLPHLRTLRVEPPIRAHAIASAPGSSPWDTYYQPRADQLSGIAFICGSHLPALETLVLDAHGLSSVNELRLLLDGSFPQLAHLALQGMTIAGPFCDELVRSKLARQLQSLDLSQSTFSDDEARTIAGNAKALPALRRLVLAGTRIGGAGRRLLEGMGLQLHLATAADPAPADVSPGSGSPTAVTLEQVTGLCPDKRAEAAARAVADLSKWSQVVHEGVRASGLCQGSEAQYHVVADLQTLRCTCDCPSRKRPCKHSLALLMLVADGKLRPGGAG